MTAFELFERAYKHHMGRFLSKCWYHTIEKLNPREYVIQAFNSEVQEYSIHQLSEDMLWITYGQHAGLKPSSSIDTLKQLEAAQGYWLCEYDSHLDEWNFFRYNSKAEAKEAYKRLYIRFFRHQDYFKIYKV